LVIIWTKCNSGGTHPPKDLSGKWDGGWSCASYRLELSQVGHRLSGEGILSSPVPFGFAYITLLA